MIILSIVLLIIGLGLWFLYKRWKNPIILHEGQIAPDFTLLDSEEKPITLSKLGGKFVILYFYPKADTPGCTYQACSIRDNFDVFQKDNVVVLGVSYDSPAQQKAFKEKYHLPFTLLSDSDKEVAKKYGAYAGPLNELYPRRMTFIIDPQQKIKKILPTVNIYTHTQSVLDALA